ncbi:MAG TPA: ATP-dependent sacrificial sulfur transferase LarE [Candidatus Nanoarchaeia archaeon]|nr:ATP-dependent sacrificial sulfur transferase LarE [Candidatus Nanoarchaeia archaeon]
MTTGNLDQKYADLKKFIAEKGKHGVVIAFSGGVDSSTLAAICHDVLGEKAVAVIAKSPTYTSMEMAEAKAVAQEIGIKLQVIETDEMSNENFSRNPENRCYYCKKELLTELLTVANQLGFKAVFEGTNFSDLSEHRPGFQAVKELPNVYSPWFENKFKKDEIRSIAKRIGLSVQNKQSLACLASRIPFNEKITPEKLSRIEKAEQIIKEITGVSQLRVRDHNGLARIEVGKDERELLCSIQTFDKINSNLKQLGFKYVTVDLEGYRTGSMLHTLNN